MPGRQIVEQTCIDCGNSLPDCYLGQPKELCSVCSYIRHITRSRKLQIKRRLKK